LIGTILMAVLVIAVGTRATDAVRLRQQETILAKLATPAAADFYGILRRRAWKVRILRAVALLSLIVILYSRNHPRQPGAAVAPRSPITDGSAPAP
jgi:hypothetical protein